MIPRIFSFYGPFNINSYGFCIALGFLLFYWLCSRDKKMNQLLGQQSLDSILVIGTIIGIIGGRLFCYISSPESFSSLQELFFIWQPGFSILGTIISLAIIGPLFLFYKKIPILPALDIFATYGALLQSVSRIGCFLAGCCHGIESSVPWAITYTNNHCYAPCGIALHPVQLYSSLSLLFIFLFMYYIIRPSVTTQRPGILLYSYLILVSMERFMLDFIRANRIISYGPFSFSQILALVIILLSITLLFYTLFLSNSKKYELV